MKKLLTVLILAGLLVVPVTLVRAQLPDQPIDPTFGDWAGFIAAVTSVTNMIFAFVIIVAVLLLIYAGFMFITAAGDQDKTATAQKALTYAAVGVGVALLARVIPVIVSLLVGEF